ncbi:calmodulin-binding protein 60 A-like isoform X2 [Hordeum vulgare subsp. vulgare]|uniref:calmodulin-binding protein 60 A-like isoform X2 n=1 Tax=Hordeum vulgare subsp. vulgare TaxID=112509 RepID=UPI001B84CFBB|nr:calmodulin-binding protein 60 A-like isoform X2 [Hordeum vulgare subsp. vulgare]
MSQKRQPEEGERPRWGGCGGGVPAESGGTSSPGEPKRQRVPALREVITEVMRKSSIEKLFSSIEPLIRRVVKEEIELALANHAAMMTRSPTYTVPSTSKNLQLQFTTKLSLPIFTGSKVEGEGTLSIALVDTLTREVVVMGTDSLLKVEIVVLEGDFEDGEGNDWTAQEFNNNIVKERQDNSSWTRSRKFRLGARSEDGCFNGVRVREAKTESFVVKDHRGELYKKHHPPVLEDDVWRLEKIGKEGAFHKRLNKEKIVTVKDFLTLLHLDAPRLRKILGTGMSTKMWEVTVEHAKTTCVLSEKVHIYYLKSPSKTAVVFNAVGEVRGLISEKFVSADDLTEIEKAEAHAAVKQAYEDWKNVSTCDSDTLVENPSQLFNMRSPSLHENGFYQLPTQVLTDDFDISHLDIPSDDIFSVEPSCALDPCAVGAAESSENRFQSELPPLGGHGQPRESHALDRFSNSLVFEESTSHASFNEDYYCRPGPDPPVSFDSQDLGAALKGFIATISKPKPYRGWRTLSYVIGWIFYTKRMAAQKRKKPGK